MALFEQCSYQLYGLVVSLAGIMDCRNWFQFGFWSDVQQDLESSRDISKCYQYEKGNYKC